MKETKKIAAPNPAMAPMTPESPDQSEFCSKIRHGTLLVVTGPSGVGKGTMVGCVLRAVDQIKKSVSVTTRECRAAETDGVEYFFRSEEEFSAMRDRGEFLEWAEFAGSHYGTPARWVQDRLRDGVDVILEIEVQGAKQVREKCDDAVLVFISPPSFKALEDRLKTRATETPEKMALRLKKAEGEMKERHLFDYEVINDNIDEAVRNLESIVYAERLRIKNRGEAQR